MTPKEKYFNYIVDDLIKKTKFDLTDRDRGVWNFTIPFPNKGPFKFTQIGAMFIDLIVFPSIIRTLINRYGLRDDDMEVVWGMYVEAIDSVVYNRTGWSPLHQM